MIEVRELDFSTPKQGDDFLKVLNSYASDIMGGGKELPRDIQSGLVSSLRVLDQKMILMAYDGDRPIGIANCFFGFSTFKAKPLVNIHDFAVIPEARGKGVALLLLKEIERRSKEKGCCKITLEVLEGNERAQKVYFDFGFEGYELDPKMGKAIFLDKVI